MGGSGRSLARPVVLLLVVLLALPVGVAWVRTPGGEAVVGHPGVAGFRQSAQVDRDRYAPQEAVVLTYRVCRARPWPTMTNSGGVLRDDSLAAALRVLDDRGDVVTEITHQANVFLLTKTWWWPGQCRSIDVEWDQRSWNQEEAGQDEPEVGGSPARGGRVEPGSYRFEVRWLVSSGGEPDEHLPAPVETAPFVLEP